MSHDDKQKPAGSTLLSERTSNLLSQQLSSTRLSNLLSQQLSSTRLSTLWPAFNEK